GLFGPSPAMRAVLRLARRVGPSRCAVHIVGEPGTGRESLARVIHAAGAHDGQPFIQLSCSAVTRDELRESLFATNQPTIYLENISELSPGLQDAAERYLTRAAAAFAGSDSAPRIIAAAQPRIWARIDRGEVRRELVDALSVVRIDVPPLRQRREDIPLLAMHFLKESCARHGVAPKTFTRAAMTLLTSLPWRGNASELRSLCER